MVFGWLSGADWSDQSIRPVWPVGTRQSHFLFFELKWFILSYASRVEFLCRHTYTFCTPRLLRFRRSFIFFFDLCKLACEAKCVEFHSLAQIKGELKLNLRIQKHYWISFESFNRLSSITKKGEIERASRPLVGFGVLIDNTIKWVTCLREIMSRYLICEMI